MARAPDPRINQAKAMYLKGMKLVEIASQLSIPEGTVRRWKCTHKWDDERSDKKANVRKRKKGGQPRNKNAIGNDGGGAPEQNKNAEKYGFFSKYLPDETREIFSAIEQADPLDLLWHQIQIAYAAIVRAQRIAYVKDQDDKTIEKIEEKVGNVIGEKWEVQQAWDKQEAFLKAQARAQDELRAMIKQYDEMLHKNWDLSTEEQQARIEQIRANTARMSGGDGDEDGGVEIVNDAPKEASEDIGDNNPEIPADI
ncbi:phage terminase small subunit [[Ruminococcus] lactaris]|uniref:phage terminase small subunit n=1 Tax=[Ruminococcus] lactaris TaxID=46228 RepID=UPI00242D80D5|nr:phage terminase small subunit [[Ruminococcus] lactaris]